MSGIKVKTGSMTDILMPVEIILYGLAYRCPCRNRKSNCPFKEVDHLSFMEKVEWIDGLNQEEKIMIWEDHASCSKNYNTGEE